MDAIVTPEEMAAIDAAAPEPVEELIERAGWAVARAAIDLLGGTYGRRVLVVAGKGNNGADGRAAARFLARRGVRVTVLDAAAMGGAGPGARLPAADLVIDAAYGTGFRGTWAPPALPADDTPVVAVDIPSGVSGLTGEVSGSPWPATRTVTFAAWKPGLLLGDGPVLAGEVVVADLGLDVGSASAHLVDDAAVRGWAPRRERDTHKWKAAALIVAGSPGMTGAAHLAARSAQRAGAGYVRLSTPGQDPSNPSPGAPTEAVGVPLPGEGWAAAVIEDADRFGAIAVGPGLGAGEANATEVRALVAETAVPVVVDGDGLRALGRQAGAVVAARPVGAAPVVLTPHDGEHEALTGTPPGPNRLGAARTLAGTTGAVVLLKGPATVVSDPAGRVLVVTAGDQRLATAGTGDVLTGILVALVAQGVPPWIAAAAAAHMHGRAAGLGPARGLVAGDLVDRLPQAASDLFGS